MLCFPPPAVVYLFMYFVLNRSMDLRKDLVQFMHTHKIIVYGFNHAVKLIFIHNKLEYKELFCNVRSINEYLHKM